MSKKALIQEEFKMGDEPAERLAPETGIVVIHSEGAELSVRQKEFNRLMKRLEKLRREHDQQRQKLDRWMDEYQMRVLPERRKATRAEHALLQHTLGLLPSLKLGKKQREALQDFLSSKAAGLLADSDGLEPAEIEALEEVVKKFGESAAAREARDMISMEFDMMREAVSAAARDFGIEIDLDGIDIHDDPAEVQQKLAERFAAAQEAFEKQGNTPSPRGKKPRKPTARQIEKQRREEELESAKQRDLKSLYKQLAKALHPDLETDPALKQHKEEWMKRLTSAHAAGDLRELLAIELEWLGAEASNLTSATDEKLGVYCALLKEQLASLKDETQAMPFEPRYSVMQAHLSPWTGLPLTIDEILRDLEEECSHVEGMLGVFQRGASHAATMVLHWAKEHQRYLKQRSRF